MGTDDLKIDKLYRPTWTCGRYNERSKTAIYFNLLSGLSFLFEGNSALVLGYILSIKKRRVLLFRGNKYPDVYT